MGWSKTKTAQNETNQRGRSKKPLCWILRYFLLLLMIRQTYLVLFLGHIHPTFGIRKQTFPFQLFNSASIEKKSKVISR